MTTLKPPNFPAIPLALALALALVSCAAPKAIVVGPPPAQKKGTPSVENATASEPVAPPPAKPDDGIRLPDMVTMPGEDEFRRRTTTPPTTKPDSGAVIARPPKEPE